VGLTDSELLNVIVIGVLVLIYIAGLIAGQQR